MDKENVQTRLEHSRSLEDAEKYKAIHTLTELGLLIPLSDVEVYHGRAARMDESEPWTVDPTFANGGNDSGNYNFNERATLYTGTYDVADEFSKARTREKNRTDPWNPESDDDPYQPEVHQISSNDPDARIIDLTFDVNSLSKEDRAVYDEAVRVLTIDLTDGSPLEFSSKDNAEQLLKEVSKIDSGLVDESKMASILKRSSLDSEELTKLISARNSAYLAKTNLAYMAHQLARNSDDIIYTSVQSGKEHKNIPINLEYVQRLLSKAHIVGIKQPVHSATIAKAVDIISFFDLEKVGSVPENEDQKRVIAKEFGSVAVRLGEVFPADIEAEHISSDLVKVLTDVHASPERIVEEAKKIEGFERVFNSDGGNWEGYSLAEHTETLLRNFDENFGDILPVEFLAPMRLAIITHDIGKPAAAHNREKHLQKDYNNHWANKYLKTLDLNPQLRGLLMSMIGDGMELVSQIELGRAKPGTEEYLDRFARKAMKDFYQTDHVTEAQVGTYKDMCKMLFICDGGAYTSMAVTRRNGIGFRNAPSFNYSFARPTDMSRRGLRLRRGSEPPAEKKLTSSAIKTPSRIRFRSKGAGAQRPKI